MVLQKNVAVTLLLAQGTAKKDADAHSIAQWRRDSFGHRAMAHHNPPSAAMPAITMPFRSPISAMLQRNPIIKSQWLR